ncbi:MAG TPA: hypothetical protein VMF09_16395 [Solirubrobacteraceae bacterium]|nr:hypothetical protein [Solirubrobacteraceae bacterium]
MQARASGRRSPPGMIRLAAAMLLTALLAGCSSAGAGKHGGAAGAPSIPTPLATSIQTSAGVWATLPMGRLDEPLNTFWQLLFRPAGSESWSNQVQATAVATNGGIVLASAPERTVLAGVRPSNLLTFSPLIATSDGGRSWSTGLLDDGLAARPDALAAGPAGRTLALVGAQGSAQVLSSVAGLSAWRTSTTTRALGSSLPGRACGLGSITAVGYLAADALIGASCSRAGVVGVFIERSGSWRLLAPAPPTALRNDRIEVLSLQGDGEGARALLGVAGSGGVGLVAAWYTDGHWSSSTPLPLRASERVSSFGPASANGMFVLLARSAGAPQLAVASAPDAGWSELAPPPAGTATVAFGQSASVDALAARETVLTVWRLGANAHAWVRRQTIDVQIEFGSSE